VTAVKSDWPIPRIYICDDEFWPDDGAKASKVRLGVTSANWSVDLIWRCDSSLAVKAEMDNGVFRRILQILLPLSRRHHDFFKRETTARRLRHGQIACTYTAGDHYG
jgi:hypothetical protein